MKILERLTNNDFDSMYEIMHDSFPTDEHRPYDEQKALLEKPNYELYGRKGENGSLLGFIAAWRFDNFLFIEHFAVNAAFRNGGIGFGMLRELMLSQTLRICLEVELPENELACRRIGFYERCGLTFNDFEYNQPPISKGCLPVPLRIMTSDGKAAKEEFEEIKRALYTKVYGVCENYRI